MALEDAHRPVVLLVDDERANRDLIRAYLEPAYQVREAADGAAALEIVRRESVDLVLLDVMMPYMNGFDTCRALKKLAAEDRYLPVILLTALGEHENRIAGLEAGADDFLSKPVDRHELGLRLQTFVRLHTQDRRIRQQMGELEKRDQLIRHQFDELRTLDGLKDDLVSLLVHDLRNPLGGLVSFLDTLEGCIVDPELRADIRLALEAGGRLRETLDDMLHVRMLETGVVRIHREIVEAADVVKEAIGSLWGVARARHVDITPVIDLADLHVPADRKLLRRAVENLLSNALKYSPPGGQVVAAVHAVSEGGVEIEVADRGAGIPDSVKEQLFQKFGSVEAARGETRRGIGLGLYLVKLVALAHGGRAVVRDRDGGGTTFGLFLPGREDRGGPVS
jgi:two-component system, sensor histidine kinase and response regulator